MPSNADIAGYFEAHRSRVYRWAFGLCRRHEDAADVVQEAFRRMLETRPMLPTEAAVVGWLRRVTQRLVIDRWRAEGSRRERENTDHAAAGTSGFIDADAGTALRQAMFELSDQQRLVVLCKFYDDMTFEQVGRELGISTPTAKTHYLRALAALRDRLQPAMAGADHHDL